jgi:acyl-coenzyme A synthetase/AMP-(fatty) acid ligase
VMNKSDHCISTAEVESTLVGHFGLADTATNDAADQDYGSSDYCVRQPA